jgi:hypothetical protein
MTVFAQNTPANKTPQDVCTLGLTMNNAFTPNFSSAISKGLNRFSYFIKIDIFVQIKKTRQR